MHYFSNEQLRHEKREIIVKIKEETLVLETDAGVFSKTGLDYGTRLLLESLPGTLHGDVLDFGCGYGPIGIYLKKAFDVSVDMVDINRRSLELAKKNALKNKVDVTVFESDIYENIQKKYGSIITNPPIRVGNEILYQILFGAKHYLLPNGSLWLVIHKDQGAKTMIKRLEEYYRVEVRSKNKGFYVICATND